MKTIVKSKKVVQNEDEMKVNTPIEKIKKNLEKVLNVDEDMDEFFNFNNESDHSDLISEENTKTKEVVRVDEDMDEFFNFSSEPENVLTKTKKKYKDVPEK